MEEGLGRAEAFVTLTNLDEENILLALFAKKIQKQSLFPKVNRLAFDDIIEGLDIGSVIYPKYLTTDYIIQHVRSMRHLPSIRLKPCTACWTTGGSSGIFYFGYLPSD